MGFIHMKKHVLLMALVIALAALPAHAQGGCTDTPENPTLILGGLASGVFGAKALHTRYRARRANKK
jgi:XrtJ-associated TM-motif-TM protein